MALERAKKEAGLCADCQHVRVIENDRGSLFYQCRKSFEDPGFPKYPRLPVRICRGYEADTKAESAD